MKRLLMILSGVLGLGLVAWWTISAVSGEAPITATVDRGPVIIGAEVTGTLRAVESVSVGPPLVPGIWQYKLAMMAPEGESVQKGQPVVGFDPSEIREKLRKRRNDLERAMKEAEKSGVDHEVRTADDELALAEAEAGLRKARLAAARPSELFSSIELEKARLDLELAELNVDNLRRRIEASHRAREAELAALESEVRHHQNRVAVLTDAERRMVRPAPRDGLVIYVTDWRQQKKKLGDSCWISDRVVEIPDLSRMMAHGFIEEALSGQLREGLPVSIRLDAHLGRADLRSRHPGCAGGAPAQLEKPREGHARRHPHRRERSRDHAPRHAIPRHRGNPPHRRCHSDAKPGALRRQRRRRRLPPHPHRHRGDPGDRRRPGCQVCRGHRGPGTG
jgi:HlyD family secretion protein